MGHAKAADLTGKLREACDDLKKQGLLQLSMDAPNVNWKTYELLQSDLQCETGLSMLNIGSCGLHIVHNSIKTGHSDSGWDLGSWMRALHWLFKDSPARREDFSELTGCSIFPLEFCGHRWLENVNVGERALEVWPHVKTYLKKVKGNKALEPTCKSYKTLQEFAKDPILSAKVQAFLSLARDIKPFLTAYQTNAPMIPFLANDMFRMMKTLLRRIITHTAMEGIKYPKDFQDVNLRDKSLYLTFNKVEIGMAAKSQTSSLCSSESSLRNL